MAAARGEPPPIRLEPELWTTLEYVAALEGRAPEHLLAEFTDEALTSREQVTRVLRRHLIAALTRSAQGASRA